MAPISSQEQSCDNNAGFFYKKSDQLKISQVFFLNKNTLQNTVSNSNLQHRYWSCSNTGHEQFGFINGFPQPHMINENFNNKKS